MIFGSDISAVGAVLAHEAAKRAPVPPTIQALQVWALTEALNCQQLRVALPCFQTSCTTFHASLWYTAISVCGRQLHLCDGHVT
jgi:hypothetical protein